MSERRSHQKQNLKQFTLKHLPTASPERKIIYFRELENYLFQRIERTLYLMLPSDFVNFSLYYLHIGILFLHKNKITVHQCSFCLIFVFINNNHTRNTSMYIVSKETFRTPQLISSSIVSVQSLVNETPDQNKVTGKTDSVL